MPKTHSALIYFHGVGDPQRHVSLGNFLDHFDLYGQRQDMSEAGRPRSFKYEAELFPEDDDVTNFVEFKRVIVRDDVTRVARVVRVYEAYWVPEARSSFTVATTLTWLAGRLWSPIRFLLSPWRSFPALRLLALFKLAESFSKPGYLTKLERYYRDFENWENRSRYPKGSYTDFSRFVARKSDAKEAGRLLPALEAWRRSARGLAWRHLLKLATLLGLVLAAVILTALFTAPAARLLHHFIPTIEASSFAAHLTSAAGLTVLALAAGYRVTRTYLYDVISWTLESERNAQFASRERVIQYSQKLIRKVAGHPQCDSITIVAHSLGSCIATEALLREGVRQKALARQGLKTTLQKISSVFTVGSPIDLIFFFFQADQTFSHRYNRIAEEKRLSISLPPFWLNGAAGTTKIYNAWSRFDPISSSMQALRKRMSERRNAIVNVEVLPASAPAPLKSHTTYFADPTLMSAIYSSVMGTDLQLDQVTRQRFFAQHPALNLPVLARPWILPSIALLGLSPALASVTVLYWTIGVYLIARTRGKRLLRDYEAQFGAFLRRGERALD
ncbi:hypothetical protein FSB78_02505 [Sphingomonas ginsenosidivorax]|uniref:Alpha/beta hydrolase n=1 Tax=Sphingomonas ginsenosidivorax TaxID=862135 RepID=A0A5C6UAM0_9SPHN|nr:hypothetical protein [Sphingomonas ginsenosidivorax]TXC69947.1 hypothetical protein FSB78_02505 [Sphingomonas ginsenosidivorax]